MSKADKSHIVKISDEGNWEVVYCPCREDQHSWHECEKCTEEEKRKLGNEYERSGYYNHDELHIMSEWCGGYATETNICLVCECIEDCGGDIFDPEEICAPGNTWMVELDWEDGSVFVDDDKPIKVSYEEALAVIDAKIRLEDFASKLSAAAKALEEAAKAAKESLEALGEVDSGTAAIL